MAWTWASPHRVERHIPHERRDARVGPGGDNQPIRSARGCSSWSRGGRDCGSRGLDARARRRWAALAEQGRSLASGSGAPSVAESARTVTGEGRGHSFEGWPPPRERFSTWLWDDHPSRMHDWTMPLAPRKEKKFHVEWLAGAAWARCATPRARAPACTEALAMSCNAACACAMSSESTTHLRYAAARCCCAQRMRRVCGVCAVAEGGWVGRAGGGRALDSRRQAAARRGVANQRARTVRRKLRSRVRARVRVRVGVRVGVRARMAVRLEGEGEATVRPR